MRKEIGKIFFDDSPSHHVLVAIKTALELGFYVECLYMPVSRVGEGAFSSIIGPYVSVVAVKEQA